MLQRIIRCPLFFGILRRSRPISAVAFSTNPGPEISVSRESTTEFAHLKLSRIPANTFNVPFMTDLCTTVRELEEDPSCRGVIISSGLSGIFSAGLYLHNLHQPRREDMDELWTVLQNFYLTFVSTDLITIAAVNGHALAGGCLLHLACDYRIMAPGYKTGLNETMVGLPLPKWLGDRMINLMGFRNGNLAAQKGTIFSSEEALRLGLVDQITPKEEILQAAEAEMLQWLKVPEDSRRFTKRNTTGHLRETTMRPDVLERERTNASDVIMGDAFQQYLGNYLQSLKKK